MRKNKTSYWTYNLMDRPKREYIDPRTTIARYIGWQKIFGPDSIYCVPEPDNYNRAVIMKKPVECLFIEDQVIYKDLTKNLWVTVMYIPDEQIGEYESWLNRINPLAYWQHKNAPKIRQRKEPAA